jgi:phosphohistidine phosphatase
MKTLCIIRHAKAAHASPLESDHDRPLDDRGKSDAALAGVQLFMRGLLPDGMLASSARRTRDTASILARELSFPEEAIQLSDELYNASPAAMREALAALDAGARTVFLVGHNPEISLLGEELTGHALGSLPTCGIVCVDLAIDGWEELHRTRTGMLRFLEVPGTFR